MLSWQVGSVKVVRVGEQLGPSSFELKTFFRDIDRDVFDSYLDQMPGQYSLETDRHVSSIHSWLIATDKQKILVDCCCGNHKERPDRPRFHQLNTDYLSQLQAAGAEPQDIDIVLCTHLHADHVGWNTRLENGTWVPTFPNAKYLCSDRDDQRFNPSRNAAIERERAMIYNDSVLPIAESGQLVLVSGNHEIDSRMIVEPAPGHTPGHVLLKLRDDGEHGLFSGDILHHVFQIFRPELNSSFCEDQQAARITRRKVLDYCVEKDALLFPTHFAAPFVVRVSRDAGGFVPRFVSGQEA